MSHRSASPSSADGKLRRLDSVYLRLSVTPECNLACRYCRPKSGGPDRAPAPRLCDRELLRLIGAIHQAIPIRKLRLTGGEPLLRPSLPRLAADLKRALPDTPLCLTTNGLLLSRLAAPLKAAGIDRINVSLDTLDSGLFEHLTGSGGLERVLAGIAAARRAGFATLKLNCVLMRSYNLPHLAALVRTAARFDCEIRFVELMPIGAGAEMFDREYYPASEALARLAAHFPYVSAAARSATAERHILEVDGRRVAVGFITSVSRPFCSRCDRIRVDSRGLAYGCLRSRAGVDLRAAAARGPEALRALLQRTLSQRQPLQRVVDGPVRCETDWPERSMADLGG